MLLFSLILPCRAAKLCELRLRDFGQGGEACCVVDGHLCKHLAVDVDLGQLQAVHELAVGKAVQACCSVDTGDPQGSHIALSLLSSCKCGSHCAHDRLLSNSVLFGSCASVALRELQDSVMLSAGIHAPFNSCHFSFLQSSNALRSSCFLSFILAVRASDVRKDLLHVLYGHIVAENMKKIVNDCGVLHSGRIVYENCADDAEWIKNSALNIYDTPGKLPWGLVHNGGTLYGPVDADVYTRSAVGNVIEKPVVLNADLYIDSGYKSYSLLDFAGQLSGEERKISFGGGAKLIKAIFSAEESNIGTVLMETTNVVVDISGRLNAKTVTVKKGTVNIVDGGFLYASADKSSVYTIGDNKNGNYEK